VVGGRGGVGMMQGSRGSVAGGRRQETGCQEAKRQKQGGGR
jgi:hypothetical protein